jgi:hypothetical protein
MQLNQPMQESIRPLALIKALTSRQLLSWFSPWDSRTIHAALTCPSTSCTKIEAGAAISMDVICAQLGSDGHDSQ